MLTHCFLQDTSFLFCVCLIAQPNSYYVIYYCILYLYFFQEGSCYFTLFSNLENTRNNWAWYNLGKEQRSLEGTLLDLCLTKKWFTIWIKAIWWKVANLFFHQIAESVRFYSRPLCSQINCNFPILTILCVLTHSKAGATILSLWAERRKYPISVFDRRRGIYLR